MFQASKRHAEGEISNDEFLNVAHQINQLFQYQEERQRSDSWDESCDEGVYPSKKKPQGLGTMSDAALSYLEHKSKLKRTQLLRPGKNCHVCKCFYVNYNSSCFFFVFLMLPVVLVYLI